MNRKTVGLFALVMVLAGMAGALWALWAWRPRVLVACGVWIAVWLWVLFRCGEW